MFEFITDIFKKKEVKIPVTLTRNQKTQIKLLVDKQLGFMSATVPKKKYKQIKKLERIKLEELIESGDLILDKVLGTDE